MSEIFIILFLILLNGIFAMSEMAVVSARKSNLQADANKGSKAAKTALKLSSDPDKFLSAVQIGITLIGILTGIFSGNKVAAGLASLFINAGMSAVIASALAKALIVILVTYLSIVFGELVPKRIALSASEKVAKVVAGPMKVIAMVSSPFVWILAKSTALIIKVLGVKSQESKVTEEEIKSIIQEGTVEGEVSPVEQDIVERVFALGDLKVNTIMTLRGDIVWLDKDMTEQEIRNAIYAGPFVTDAKRHFSKTNCAAWRLGRDLVPGSPIRQDFLRRALEWMADHESRLGHAQSAVGYMAVHQHDPNANNLWTYYQNVINWAVTNFSPRHFKRIMKGLDWAMLYDRYNDSTLDTAAMARRISALMRDDEIQRKQGIIPYVLTGDEHWLDLRAFPEDMKLAVWEEQGHVCPLCKREFDFEFMEGDHITPWRDGGRTVKENCQMLCRECNRRKAAR